MGREREGAGLRSLAYFVVWICLQAAYRDALLLEPRVVLLGPLTKFTLSPCLGAVEVVVDYARAIVVLYFCL